MQLISPCSAISGLAADLRGLGSPTGRQKTAQSKSQRRLVMSVKHEIYSYHIVVVVVVVVGHEKLGGVLVDAAVVENLKERFDEEPSSLLLLED